MILKGEEIQSSIQRGDLGIVPCPNLQGLVDSGQASVDLRLGRWLVELRHSRAASLAVLKGNDQQSMATSEINEVYRLSRYHFIPFGEKFFLHPGRFVLGITLEWLVLPNSIAAFVTGKSSWGRRGLIIETAAGIHPGFSGCLTLEITNVGEVPLDLTPGLRICQVFFHQTSDTPTKSKSQFSGKRRPVFGVIEEDEIVRRLRGALGA